MEVNIKLLPDKKEILDDLDIYRKLVRKLNYLTVTRHDIV